MSKKGHSLKTTKQEKKILERLGVGRENALKARQLGEERDIRYIVSNLRKKNYAICSGNEGYWIAKNEFEKTESLGKINSRIKELTAVAEGLKKAKAYETIRDNN